MNWKGLEERGREKLKLGDSWILYSVELDATWVGDADVKFARKDSQGVLLTKDSVCSTIKYDDL